jgi:hypothetical protein
LGLNEIGLVSQFFSTYSSHHGFQIVVNPPDALRQGGGAGLQDVGRLVSKATKTLIQQWQL